MCLLPARNAAAHIDDWLASVSQFADAVVALDDGSEDYTGAMLRADPLVVRVLDNPRRASYGGWDDATNRARLLDAAGDLDPGWIMQLDADERMSADDARALRAFLLGAADPAFAYSFRVYRMVGDLDHYDADHEQWVLRCFRYDLTHRLVTERLHMVPVPTAFSPDRRRRTTFRIQHLVGLTSDNRRQQFDKYREVDPDRRYQGRYDHLLREPVVVRPWAPRSPALHPIANEPAPIAQPGGAANDVMLSAIVVAVDGDTRDSDLTARVGALVEQDSLRSFEVLAVVGRDQASVAGLRVAFPEVPVVTVDRGTPVEDARAVGFQRAIGRYLVAPSGCAAPGYVSALLRAHTAGYALVAGAVDTGATSRSGVALHALEHWDELPGTAKGVVPAPTAEYSYARDAWEELGSAADPVTVNAAMFTRGYSAGRASDAVTALPAPAIGAGALLVGCFARGRAHGRRVANEIAPTRRRFRRDLMRATVAGPVPVRRTLRALRHSPRPLRTRLWSAAPLIAAGAVATWAGGAAGYAYRFRRGGRTRRRRRTR